MHYRKIAPFVSLLLFLLANPVHATIYSWSGNGATANWTDPGNWGFAGTPTNGDTVIFSALQPLQSNTNNIANLTLVQIRFVGPGGGYAIFGNPITLTDSIQATNTSGANSISNAITLSGQNIIFNVATNSSLTVSGAVSGVFGIIKNGPGTLVLAGPLSNTYGGLTTVNAGLMQLEKNGSPAATAIPGDIVIGDGTNVAILQNIFNIQIAHPANLTINTRGVYDVNTRNETIGSNIVLNGSASISNVGNLTLTAPATFTENGNGIITGTGTISLGAGPTTFNITPQTLYLLPNLSGASDIIKIGSGTLRLNGANSYTGLTTISAGYLWASNSLALGATNNGVIVNNGASLTLEGGITVSNKSLILNGNGPSDNWGALDSEIDFIATHNTNGWTGPIILNADSTVMPYENVIKLILSGPISGPGGLLVNVGADAGDGTLTLSGLATNSYAGTTTVGMGVLELGRVGFDLAVSGPLVIGDNTDPANSTVVRLLANNQINNPSTVTLNSSGLLDENGFVDGIGGLNGTGNVSATGAVLDFYGSGAYEFDGLISGIATIDFDVAGTHVWTGSNTYTGPTHLNAGTLWINGFQPVSAFTVNGGAILGGSGTIGNLLCSGTLAPGPASGVSPGTLTCSNLVFTSTGKYAVDLSGPYAGAGYDQVLFHGTNALANATLQLLPAITTPLALNETLFIVENQASSASNGIFNGLPSGSIINLSNYKFSISYDGFNNVTLKVLAIPGAAGSASVSSGDGNHSIDPNDCNNLSLSISNLTGTPMTGVTATLATTTPQVLITQPYSPYPNVPANGSSTNSAPFQISTLTNFVCGTTINLQLSVNSSMGAFTVPFTVSSGSLGTPVRYDVTGNVAIPDVGSVDSTNVVSGFTGKLDKVTVALYLTHPFDSDLTNISLIAPDNTTVLLSSANGGSGANYGASCSPDSSRTTFDDAAATSITAGTAPFTGTFRPQGSLSNFIGNATPNGNWRLHIADGFGGSLGTLRCWSLFLYPIACSPGSGVCSTCTTPIVSAVTLASSVQTNRWDREGIVSSCTVPKPWAGFGDTGTNFHYNLHSFPNNTGADACVTILLQSTSDLMAGAYLNAYQPTNVVANFLADSGDSTGDTGGATTFSCTVPAGNVLLVEVNEVTQNSGTQPYSLNVAGLPCPPPALSINEGPTNSMLLTWPTSAGGYNLEGTAGITTSSWAIITNEPVIISNQFTVTNPVPADHYFRLHKP